MWCGKMAARWRGKDSDLNAGKMDFPVFNAPNELVFRQHNMEGDVMDTQSCMDHSILAIFEDSSVTPEDKSGMEEENETLLSALTEMLDSVEDDDGTLSPFDTLPDTKLLTHQEHRNNSVELSFAERLRPRSKSTNVKCAIKIEVDEEDERKREKSSTQKMFKHQSEPLFVSKKKTADSEVEVFTPSSLANLVKIMHSYCLKLHVEEERDELRRDHTLFSQEEVWKYERPSEESDEEINVVSDDEVTVKETKKKEEVDDGKQLKSVLLNGNSSKPPPCREKKRVSFGPVQVASFDESEEKQSNEKNLKSQNVSKAFENLACSALEPQPLLPGIKKAAISPLKGETKAKSLSLQQYRQLRQKRQPLVEKQGNYTTKWPSVPEPPKELTPILCLQGKVQISCGPRAAQTYPNVKSNGAQSPVYKTHHTSAPPGPCPTEIKPSTFLCHSGLKRPRNESKISSFHDIPANINAVVSDSKRSAVKKPLCIDPPNPVLLPLPVSQTMPPFTHTDSESLNTSPLQEIQNEFSGSSPQRDPSSSIPKPEEFIKNTVIMNKDPETHSAVSCRSPLPCPTTTQIKSSPEKKELQPQICTEPKIHLLPSPALVPVGAPVPLKETAEDVSSSNSHPEEASPTLQGVTADSGIEAADVTSLLEQFEETQAKDGRVESKPVVATSLLNVNTDRHLDETPLTSPVETHLHLSTSDLSQTQTATGNLPNLQTSEGVAIPEPLGTEIILSTEKDVPARRKNPPSKAIQIIDPRPLPSRKTHASFPESPAARIYSHISSDHDYCGPADRSSSCTAQHCRLSDFKDDQSQVTGHDSGDAAKGKRQTSTGEAETNRTINASAKSVMEHPPEKPSIKSETNTVPDKSTLLFDRSATSKGCCPAAEDRAPHCTLPTPPPSPPVRGREKRRYRRRSRSSSCSSSSSSSSSASRSPKRQKRCHKRSESSSCSSSCSRSISRSPPRRHRWSYSGSRCSRSRSRSWSHSRSPSRSRSPSPRIYHRQWRDVYSNRESRRLRREQEIRIQKLKAIDERRVVYVGRICRSMTHDELRERFSQFGEVECVSLHFRDKGDHYGFVTFYNMEDAFAAIDNGGKLRRPDELPFDICFGGRRQFCNSDYADLDANRDADLSPAKSKFEDLDFDSLLKQAQSGLKR
ncbi:peroxisome proliferator-activated receptor gamma coactivator-related protein 1 [Cheilinus undulatus]|uniref:peroxisome proliferator-activated receptor gamma coactivator-related protein 1 n=1 Tax=Cheilinus undulatus TaxID=241271 RepID=UPI001BD5DA79|nr:peroxisome proliferator-activated receptor gamma coactivator-related protein 1 [Cheilinus undulatus]